MKKINKKTVFLIVIGLFAVIGLFFLYMESSRFNNREAGTKGMDATLCDIIKTAKPVHKNFIETCHFFGEVKTMNRVDIIASETGKIISAYITEGMPVVKGQLLFVIGGTLIDYKLKTIADKIILLKKRIALAEQIFTNDRKAFVLQKATKKLKRRVALAERTVELNKKAFAEKFIKQNDLINSMDALAARRAELAAFQRTVKIRCFSDKDTVVKLKGGLKAMIRKQRQAEKVIHILAGFDGVVAGYRASPGGQVQKGDKLAEIISKKNIYIRAVIFLKNNGIELKGKKAFINLSGNLSNNRSGNLPYNTLVNISGNKSRAKEFHGKNIKNISHADIIFGTISNVMPQRTAAGADIVWIKGHDLDSVFKPGEVVSGNIVLSMHKNALAIPASAVVRDQHENSFVFLKISNSSGSPDVSAASGSPVLHGSSKFYRKSVKTGIISYGWAEILSGLKKEDKIVVRGAYELFYNDFSKIYKVVD